MAYPIIDNAGHLGGLAAGMGLGCMLSRLGQTHVGAEVAAEVKLAGHAASALLLAGIASAIGALLTSAFLRGASG